MNTTTMKSTEIMSGSTSQKKIEKKIELKINKKLSNNMNAQTIKKITTYLKYKADMKTFKYEQDFVVDADATITGVEKMTLMYDEAPEKPTDEELEDESEGRGTAPSLLPENLQDELNSLKPTASVSSVEEDDDTLSYFAKLAE